MLGRSSATPSAFAMRFLPAFREFGGGSAWAVGERTELRVDVLSDATMTLSAAPARYHCRWQQRRE